MHRRKSSKDTVEQENHVLDDARPEDPPFPHKTENPNPKPLPNGSSQRENANDLSESAFQSPPLTARANLRPSDSTPRQTPASAGPYRTTFNTLPHAPPPNGYRFPASPLSKSFSQGHGRTLSSSGASVSFGSSMLSPPPRGFGHVASRSISTAGTSSPMLSVSPPEDSGLAKLPDTPATPPSTRRHHHQRIHSRNLSVYFPRPGSIPVSSIAEDSDMVQEATVSLNDEPQVRSVRLQDPPGPRRLGEGFTFGGRLERTSSTSSSDNPSSATSSKPMRRGHHHKHSLSHNFFSFLAPGANLRPSYSPEPTWMPASPHLATRTPSSSTFAQAQNESGTAVGLTSPNPDPLTRGHPNLFRDTVALSVIQFVLGAALWVSGQQNGSLACTGLGYWVIFDSFGVALRHVLPAYLSSESTQSRTRRPYGNARIETLLLFAQTIYLIFSAVYVCKEAVEHLLLAAGEGYLRHHFRDEDVDVVGMRFPIFLILTTIGSLLSTCLFYDNHRRLITTSGHKLPSFSRIFTRSNYAYSSFTSAAPAAIVLTNPFTVAPLVFSVALILGALLLPPMQQESYDLLLALFEAILTFKIAYPAAEVQGTTLLQTAPPRGLPGARMEAFLRVMREIERHPLVLHLPAPHIWQLTPSTTTLPPRPSSFTQQFSDTAGPLDALVVTLELHVRHDTDDDEVLALTRWAHDRCRIALGLGIGGVKDHRGDDVDGAEITIGIVKG